MVELNLAYIKNGYFFMATSPLCKSQINRECENSHKHN